MGPELAQQGVQASPERQLPAASAAICSYTLRLGTCGSIRRAP